MLILAQADCTATQLDEICAHLRARSVKPVVSRTRAWTLISVADSAVHLRELLTEDELLALPAVQRVIYASKGAVFSSLEWRKQPTILDLGDSVRIGHDQAPCIIAGPCSIESADHLRSIAHAVRQHGAGMLRGGLFKPRTSPYSFQGLEKDGFAFIREVLHECGLKFVTEAMDEHSLELVVEHADMIQIGSRNMHNSALLKKVGETRTPVMLKRGFSATMDELMQAADYIMAGGNEEVVLCERGIRTFADHTRNTLDLSIVPALKERTHLPVIVDPSHGTGKASLVTPMALAALAAGADGIMVEVHDEPEYALSDGEQALTLPAFAAMMSQLHTLADALNRPMALRV